MIMICPATKNPFLVMHSADVSLLFLTLLSTPSSISTPSFTAPITESKALANCISTPSITAPVESKAPICMSSNNAIFLMPPITNTKWMRPGPNKNREYFLMNALQFTDNLQTTLCSSLVKWSREGGHSARLQDVLDCLAKGHETGELADSHHHRVLSLQVICLEV
ncbi:hypothetical protein AZE42_11882 [Rhizopogon vesiculosus]|uniref:Uncharacterized protein n=1 Tax=Rhizopogon vesiculosus TaxID=180088 RepID=A0A1J8QA07_9AGAM|nr:hypothetical protein AZE42_11882 [Rhizopogon vesiculosus]